LIGYSHRVMPDRTTKGLADPSEGPRWDCVVVGGGAAGLSAALVLGRARRRTLVLDAGAQSNRAAHGIGGLLGNDTRPPADFYAAGRRELSAYPSVRVRDAIAVGGRRSGEGFALDLDDGSTEQADRVLLATGMRYRYPPLSGIEELWGGSVFHCPFCHGWEVRGQALGVLDRGASGVARATLLRAWSEDVTLLTDGPGELDDAQLEALGAAGVHVDERAVAELRASTGALEAVAFSDGSERRLAGLLVPVTLHQRDGLAAQLGARMTAAGPLSDETVEVDARFATCVPGLFAAGDVSGPLPSVPNAIMAGAGAAAAIVHELMAPRHAPASS
jgi:thioredoxin reductase